MIKIYYTLLFLLVFVANALCQSGRPSAAQMEADRKKLAEAMKELEKTRAGMSPTARKSYDSMLNSVGMGSKIDNAVGQVLGNGTGTPTLSANEKVSSSALAAAKSKASEIYKGLQSKGAKSGAIGNAAAMLWVQGKTQIALDLFAQVCEADAANTDNLNNYAAALTMMGQADKAIPILNKLNAKFKKNSTILNNLGQAWFALGDIDKAEKYLDSTLRISATHPQANMTRCLIDQRKGNKTAAVAHARASFKQAYSDDKKGQLRKMGYQPVADDYNYPMARPDQAPDLLNLGGWSMPSFPKSVAESKALAPVWKQFRADIDKRISGLQKISDQAAKEAVAQMQDRINKGIAMKNKVLANPGAVNQSSLAQFNMPFFGEKVSMKETIVLQNLGKKRAAAVQKIKDFILGDGAALRKKYEEAKKGIEKEMKEDEKKSVSQTVDPAAYCPAYVKAADAFLQPYNTALEGLYFEYLQTEKQLLNETSWANLYTTWPETSAAANTGFQMQWLRDLAMTGFSFESITHYTCEDASGGKGGQLSEFRDPSCDINSYFSQTLGLLDLGFRMQVNCNGISTSFNALIFGVTLNQDLDHAGFGDSFKNCTVSIGPKAGMKAGMGPVEVGVEGKLGADIEIDRNGVKDVVIKAGAEASAEIGSPVKAAAGVEASVSLNSGAGSVGGTGMFQ